MPNTPSLSDGAIAVFAFAAYHQLQSGQPVSKVVIDDGQGHHADCGGTQQLVSQGLARPDDDFLLFTEPGLGVLARVIQAIKSVSAVG